MDLKSVCLMIFLGVAITVPAQAQTVVTTLPITTTEPVAMTFDGAGTMYVAEYSTGRVLKVSASGVATTFARLSFLYGIAVDSTGNVYVSEISLHRIRKIAPDGTVTTLAGNGQRG